MKQLQYYKFKGRKNILIVIVISSDTNRLISSKLVHKRTAPPPQLDHIRFHQTFRISTYMIYDVKDDPIFQVSSQKPLMSSKSQI